MINVYVCVKFAHQNLLFEILFIACIQMQNLDYINSLT